MMGLNWKHWLFVALALVAAGAWLVSRRELDRAEAIIAGQQQIIKDAEAREREREAQLRETLAALEQQKKETVTPQQVILRISKFIPSLPGPLTLETVPLPSGLTEQVIQMPIGNAKPLFDFAVNCEECQAKLTYAEQRHLDDMVKFNAAVKQRDAALSAAKGGSWIHRAVRNAKWLAIGAAAGAAAGAALARR